MMPAQLPDALPNTVGVDLAMHGVTNGDWLGFGGGIAIGVLAVAVAVAVAWWQRLIQLRDRAADRAEQQRRQDDERDRERRLDHRDVWRAEYEEIRELLKLGGDIAYRAMHEGPHTIAEQAGMGLARFKMKADQLAGRCPDTLQKPLLRIATLADRLAHAPVPEAADVVAAYTTAAGHPVPAHLQVRAAHLLAIEQDRAARELAEELSAAWRTLRDEWGM
ncbi:hypothetical protein ABZY58_29050 [Micromonospora tulbaghiae]|uniref:hypothetical protein n=1 Tax=Micromonospora tulbaghiae TaxID=479978 RepID=UPI0033B8986D